MEKFHNEPEPLVSYEEQKENFLLPHQVRGAAEVTEKLKTMDGCLLLGGMRTGKTRVMVQACVNIGAKQVMFLTKKANIHNVLEDYLLYKDTINENIFDLEIMTPQSFNNKQNQKLDNLYYDVLILDESHSPYGAFPKRNVSINVVLQYNKKWKEKGYLNKVLLLTATPFPESKSQLYHQLSLIPNCKLRALYPTFYHFAKQNVIPKTIRVKGGTERVIYRETNLLKSTDAVMKDYIVIMKSVQKPLNLYNQETISKECTLSHDTMQKLRKKGFLTLGGESVQFHEPMKELHMLRMLSGGVYHYEKMHHIESRLIHKYGFFSCWKQEYLIQLIKMGKRVAVFYEYKAEKYMFTNHDLFKEKGTFDIASFNEDEAIRIVFLQTKSKCEGIRINKIDEMVFYTTPYSTVCYIQARQRGITYFDKRDRNYNLVFLLNTSKFSYDKKVYSLVSCKHENFKNNLNHLVECVRNDRKNFRT